MKCNDLKTACTNAYLLCFTQNGENEQHCFRTAEDKQHSLYTSEDQQHCFYSSADEQHSLYSSLLLLFLKTSKMFNLTKMGSAEMSTCLKENAVDASCYLL